MGKPLLSVPVDVVIPVFSISSRNGDAMANARRATATRTTTPVVRHGTRVATGAIKVGPHLEVMNATDVGPDADPKEVGRNPVAAAGSLASPGLVVVGPTARTTVPGRSADDPAGPSGTGSGITYARSPVVASALGRRQAVGTGEVRPRICLASPSRSVRTEVVGNPVGLGIAEDGPIGSPNGSTGSAGTRVRTSVDVVAKERAAGIDDLATA